MSHCIPVCLWYAPWLIDLSKPCHWITDSKEITHKLRDKSNEMINSCIFVPLPGGLHISYVILSLYCQKMFNPSMFRLFCLSALYDFLTFYPPRLKHFSESSICSVHVHAVKYSIVQSSKLMGTHACKEFRKQRCCSINAIQDKAFYLSLDTR